MFVCEPKFHSWGRCTIALTQYTLRFEIQSFLWPLAYYINYIIFRGSCILHLGGVITWILYFASRGCNYVDPLFRILGV